MTEVVPTLQAIRNRFDTEAVVLNDPAITSGISVDSTESSYRITVYPQREYDYEGFVIDARAPQGLFGVSPPTRVEVGRGPKGILRHQFTSEIIDVPEDLSPDGSGKMQAFRRRPIPAQEGLVLPGDPGFELFDQLQAELADLKQPIIDTLSVLGVALLPTEMFLYEPRKHGFQRGGVSDWFTNINKVYKESKAILERTTDLRVNDADGGMVALNLDGSLEYPINAKIDQDPLMVYRSGTATIQQNGETETRELDMDTLIAFAGLYASVRKLYR